MRCRLGLFMRLMGALSGWKTAGTVGCFNAATVVN